MNETARFQTVDGEDMVFESAKAEGRIVGRMLDMHLEQRFRNPSRENVEVVYTFPLPWQAVLMGLEVELNGETLTAQVKAKSTARAEYEEALSEGDTGILLTVNRDRSHTLELGNLMPGESCVIRLHYVQILQPEQGSLRLTLPTTLAPRYGDPLQDGGYEPHAAPEISTSVEYPFDIHLTVQGELVNARLGSPSHKVAIRSIPAVGMKESHVLDIRLASAAWLDRDFVLLFEELPHASLGLASWDRLDAGLGVVMASFTPRLPTRQNLPVTVKVLVDCSGSMAGDSIQAARSALQGVLKGLKPEDRFSLSRFGSTVEHRSKALWKGAPAALAAARRWAETLEADLGGTQMNDAILSTLALPGAQRCDMLLVTDGDIHAIDAVIESAQQSGHRFFVVGIGSSVSEGLLRRLAEDTGGSCEFVAPGEQVQPAILRLYQRMRSPVVTHARIAWPPGCSLHAASELPKSVFDGDDITVFARLQSLQAQALAQPIQLRGRIDGIEGEVLLAELTPAFIADEGNTLARLAANQRYWQLRNGGDEVPAVLTKQLPALAEKYQLVTDDTSLVLVKHRADGEKALDMPQLKKVKGMLAAGHGGHGSVLFSRNMTDDLPFGLVMMSAVRSSTGLSAIGAAPRAMYRMLESRSSRSPRASAPRKPSKFLDEFLGTPDVQSEPVRQWKAPPSSRDTYWAMELDSPTNGVRHYEGLTPAGLAHALRNNPEAIWPTRYEQLREIAIGERVIEWLEFVVGAGHQEDEVVRAFLDVMKEMEFTPLKTVEMMVGRLLGKFNEQLPATERQLRTLILSAMAEASATRWPASVLDFAETSFVS
jgi:Ca-activated chloride channel homolog